MRTKLLIRLRRKFAIMESEVHVIKILYSVKPLHSYKNNDPLTVEFGTFSFKEAQKKQRELILKHIYRDLTLGYLKLKIKNYGYILK